MRSILWFRGLFRFGLSWVTVARGLLLILAPTFHDGHALQGDEALGQLINGGLNHGVQFLIIHGDSVGPQPLQDVGLLLLAAAGANINLLGGGDGNLHPRIDFLLLLGGGLALDVGDQDAGNDGAQCGGDGLNNRGDVKSHCKFSFQSSSRAEMPCLSKNSFCLCLILVAYSRAECISPLQCASGIRWTALAVASPRAMEALVLWTMMRNRSCCALVLSAWATSFSSMRPFSRQTTSPMMALGMPIAAIKARNISPMSICITGITPFPAGLSAEEPPVMLVGGGKLILTKGGAKLTEAQVHGPDDGVLLLGKGAEAFDDLEAAHGPAPFIGKCGLRPAQRYAGGPGWGH
nr:MAG TPA: hypothetical protein [Caudoviricetes sp.]